MSEVLIMRHFEQFMTLWCDKMAKGELDMAIVYDRFVKGGLYTPPSPEDLIVLETIRTEVEA